MSKKTYIFNVEMSCEGCANAISNVLNRHKDKGISDFEVKLEDCLVRVESTLPLNAVQEIVQKSGKNVTHSEELK